MKQYTFDPFTLHIEVRILTHDVLSSFLCKSYNTNGTADSLSQQELLHCEILHWTVRLRIKKNSDVHGRNDEIAPW